MNKRFLSIAASTAIMASAIVFTGCGSSSSSSSGGGGSSGSGTYTGFFIDAPVSGLYYTSTNGTSTTNGVTGYNGNFTYNPNANISFYLGDTPANGGIYLGTKAGLATNATNAGPSTINATTAATLAQLFQAMNLNCNQSASNIELKDYKLADFTALGITGSTLADGSLTSNVKDPTTQFWKTLNASTNRANSPTYKAASTGIGNATSSFFGSVLSTITPAAALQTAQNNLAAANVAVASSSGMPLNATTMAGVNLTAGNFYVYFGKTGTMQTNITGTYTPGTYQRATDKSVYLNWTSGVSSSLGNASIYAFEGATTKGKKVQVDWLGTASNSANNSAITKQAYNINASELLGKSVTVGGTTVTFGATGNDTALTKGWNGLNATISGQAGSKYVLFKDSNGNSYTNNSAGLAPLSGATTITEGTNTTDSLAITNGTGDGYLNLTFEVNPALTTAQTGSNGIVAQVVSNIVSAFSALIAAIVSFFG